MRPCPDLQAYLDEYRVWGMTRTYTMWEVSVSDEMPDDDDEGVWRPIKQGWFKESNWRPFLVFSTAFVRAILEMRPDLKSAQLFYELSGGKG